MRAVFFVVILAVLAAGCRPPPVPAFEDVSGQIMADYFAAAAGSDATQAERQLKRLQDALPEAVFPTLARRKTRLRVVLVDLNKLLRDGRVEEAAVFITKAVRELGPVPDLKRADEAVQALRTVFLYRRQGPFLRSDAMEQALVPVLARQAVLERSPEFKQWLARQTHAVTDLRRKETESEAQKLFSAYDDALLTGRTDPDACLTRLAVLGANSAAVARTLELVRTPADRLEAWLDQAAAWADPVQAGSLEVAFCREWAKLTPAVRARLALQKFPAEPATLCGILLRARLALAAGNLPQATAWAERLVRQTPVSEALLTEGLCALVLPRDQFRARTWRAPFPTLTDFLNRLEQLRQTKP